MIIYREKSLFMTLYGIKHIYFLPPNIKNTYLLRNLMYEIDIFDVHNFWTLIIIIFHVETLKNIFLESLSTKHVKWLSLT